MVCVGGRYQLLGELGRGGTSTVFLAVDTVLHKQWAVKETLLQGDEKYRQLILQSLRAEVEVLKECDHPAIPRIVDFFEENGRAYAVRDYVKGRSLKSIVDEQGLQDAQTVRDWGMQLCAVLAYLHSHYPPILYGDLKPSHVMIADDGSVRLIDFGAATQLYTHSGALDLRTIEQPDARFATPRFTAPEVMNQSSSLSASSDVYAIGMTLRYALLPNEMSNAHLRTTSSSTNRILTEQLISVLATATALKPSQRYQDCEAMFSALQSCGSVSNQLSKSYRSSKSSKSSRAHSLIHKRNRNKEHYRHNRRNQNSKSSKHFQKYGSCLEKYAWLNEKHGVAIVISCVIAVLSILLFSCLGALSSNAATKQANQNSAPKTAAPTEHTAKSSAESSAEPSDGSSAATKKHKQNNAIERIKADYNSYIRLAERESSADVACRYIVRAMQLQNDMLQKNYIKKISFKPLHTLLEIQLADQQWSASEEKSFMNLLNKYEKQLRENTKDWVNLTGAVGKAYWYYFAGFSGKVSAMERLSRMRVAQAWFIEAQKYKKEEVEKDNSSLTSASEKIGNNLSEQHAFSIYIAIADGYARLVDVAQDSPSLAKYQQYARQLQQLVTMAQQEKNDVLRVDTGELVLQSLHSWLRMFRESGFSKQESKQLCEDAHSLLEEAHVSNEDVQSGRKIALESVKQILDEINNAFSQNQ